MPSPVRSAPRQDHVFILDRMAGRYRDCGEATTTDRVLSWFSGGRVRIAPPKDAAPAAKVDPYPTGFDR